MSDKEMTDKELEQRLEEMRQENLKTCWMDIAQNLKDHKARLVGLPRYERTVSGDWVTVVDIGIEDAK